MIGLCSLALLALQSTAGLPPGTGVDALLRFDATGDYLPNGQSLVTAGDDTYVLTSGTSFSPASGMRNWTRTRLDAAGSVVWSHTDYQVALGTSNVFTGDLVQAPLVAPTPGLLLSAQVDARDQGTYRLLAHSLVDGGEVWSFEPDVGPNGLEITANVQSFLLLDDPNGVVFQVLVLGGDLVVRRLDAFSGTLISVSTYLTEFDGSGVFDAALSADRQQLYLCGFVSINNLFETKSSGIALAIDTNTGAELWRTVDGERLIYELEEQPGTSELALLAAGDLGDRRLWAVDGPSGTEAWSQLLTAPVIGPSEMRYSPDGSRLVVASRQPFQPFPINEWTPGGVLEAYDSAAGAFLWERDVSGAPGFLTTLALEPQQLAVHPGGTVLWSYTWTTTLPFYENETAVLEGVDLGTGALLFDEQVEGRNYARAQVVAGTPNFAFLQSDTVDPLSEEVRDPLVRRIVASSGADDFLYEPEDSGPVVSFAVNFEATDDATRAAMMRYVEGVEPRLELVWLDLATGAELWSDVLPATDGLNIADDFQDRNREMLLSPDESVLISVVRGDGGKAYKLRLRAYEAATGQLLWTDEFDKQKGVSLFSDGLTRPGNRSVEVTDQEVILAGNITQVGGMLLASRDLWTGAANWTISSEAGTSNYAYSTHVAVDGDDVFAFLEAPVGALATHGRRIVRVDRATGTILGFREVDTNGFLTRLFAKGGGEPLLVCDNTVTGSPLVLNTRLLSADLGTELGLFPGDFGAEPLAPGEGYLVGGEFQVADAAGPGEVDVNVPLLANLDPAPGGPATSIELLDRGQLAFDVLDQDPATGEPAAYVRFWDATDGSFMWAGSLFGGTGWELGALAHLESLPGRAGFVGSDEALVVSAPAPDTRAPAPVVQILDLPELVVEPTEVSLAGGTQLDYWLRRNADAGVPQAYLLLGGLDEVSDGPVLDGIQMPFAATDAYTLLTLLQANQANFVDTLGLLDEFGNARARINSPAGLDPALAGETFHYAWLTIDLAPSALITDVSHTVQTFKLP